MARRFTVVGTNVADAQWRARFERELAAADWAICAEWAGVEDDDEAERVVAPLSATLARQAGDELVVEFGEAGVLRVRALTTVDLEALRHEGLPGGWSDGLLLTVEGASGVEGLIVTEVCQAIAIGLAGESGWVKAPSGLWDVPRRAWC